MDEKIPKPLQYGQFGNAVYSSATQSWEFSRTLAPPPHITYTGASKTSVQSPSTLIERSSKFKPSTLSRGYPELLAGYHLARNETLSHTITAAGEACNPLVSCLLDFGRALDVDVDTSGRRAVSIVAFASGECGNIISLRTLADDTVELEQSTTALRVPTIGDEDRIEWLGDGAPVRQVSFPPVAEDRATFMAARLTSTAVFKPLYRRAPVSVSAQRVSDAMALDYQSSRLDPNFLFEISTSHTGGGAHADVKFNPWNQNQLAIVDEEGNWSMWELRNQYRRNRDNWTAACVTSSTLPWVGLEEGQNSRSRGRHDGWLAVEWAGNQDHIIVCDRRSAMLYRMEGDQAYPYSMELGFRRQSEWILDIKRSSHNPSHIFILTTSRLVWFKINLDLKPVNEDPGPSLSPFLAWRHYRDTDDTTLQLTSLGLEQDFYLILYSRLSQLVLAFCCPESVEGSHDSVSVPDPFILHVPPISDDEEDLETDAVGTHFSTLVLREVAPTAVGEQSLDDSLSFLKAFALDSSLRVRESLFSRPSTAILGTERFHGRDVLRVRNMRLTGLQKKILNTKSGFIVDDWDESTHGHGLASGLGIDSIAPLAEPQFTLDYTQIYAIATGILSLQPRENEGTGERNIQASLQKLLTEVSDPLSSESPTSQTALEILRESPILDDIDQNTQVLATFVSQFASNHAVPGNQDHLILQPYDLLTPRSTQQEQPAEVPKLDLVAIYDRLVNYWLIELPPDIPGRARISKEKAIRHFVADIVLSQIVSVHESIHGGAASNNETFSSYSSGGPMKSDGYFSYGLPTSSVDQSFHSDPITPATQSSSALGDLTPQEPQSNKLRTFTVLSSYTDFERSGTASRDAERILDHWKPGTDPSTYSFISEQSQLAASSRATRRKSRRNMSQSMKNMGLDSSIPLPVTSPAPVRADWGSQPDINQPPAIRLQSSQITEDLPMTQVERGAFGGREANKKSRLKARKKKRAAGF